MRNILKTFDEKLILLINEKMKTKFLDSFMVRFTNLGSAVFISAFTFILIIFGKEDWRNTGIQAATTLAISQSITYGLKSLLGRERPYNILKNLNTFGIILKDYSFPSGHTSASFSLATTIALKGPILSVLVLSMALLVGISRIYLGVHYPTDVAAGIILGVGSAVLVHLYLFSYVIKFINSFGI
ncbi:MAG: phosphatase PAP2 family protein [Tissierellia bacterium]|nr:phosphatase PAP2 family protein [Tissierellia bacterium]